MVGSAREIANSTTLYLGLYVPLAHFHDTWLVLVALGQFSKGNIVTGHLTLAAASPARPLVRSDPVHSAHLPEINTFFNKNQIYSNNVSR